MRQLFLERCLVWWHAARTGAGVVFARQPTTWNTLSPKTTPDPFARNTTLIHLLVLYGPLYYIANRILFNPQQAAAGGGVADHHS